MTAPTFGKRDLNVAPSIGPPSGPPPPRRMRSHAAAIGVVGVFGLGLTGALGYQEYQCWPPKPGQPDTRPGWCFHHGGSYGGHGWGFSSRGGGGSVGHASFGGFGAHGGGHGGS